MRDEFEKVRKVRPLYGCRTNRGRIDMYEIERVAISVFLDSKNNPLHRRFVVAFGGFTQLGIRGNLELRLLTWSHLQFSIELGGPCAGELYVRLINIFDKTHKLSLIRTILRDDEKIRRDAIAHKKYHTNFVTNLWELKQECHPYQSFFFTNMASKKHLEQWIME
jgi:hypothetical protein